MAETISGARPVAESPLEAPARAMSEFMIRTAILPFTLLLSKPRDIAHGAATGDYRLLPTPFLLSLITGIAVSGLFLKLDTLDIQKPGEFVDQTIKFYSELKDLESLFFAIPYIFGLWAFASLLSMFMWRGVREAQTLFGPLSWSMTSLVQLTFLAVMVAVSVKTGNDWVGTTLVVVVLGFAVLLCVKLVRLILVVRKDRSSPLVGAILASAFSVLIVFFFGTAGSGMAYATYQSRDYIAVREQFEASERRDQAMAAARRYEFERDYQNAVREYNKAIAADATYAEAYAGRSDALLALQRFSEALSDAERNMALVGRTSATLNQMCWVRAVWNRDLDAAMADCNEALALNPGDPLALDSRALIHVRKNDLTAALADYEAALKVYPEYAHARFGRGIVRQLRQEPAKARADFEEALRLDPTIAQQYAGYGLVAEGLTARSPQRASRDPFPQENRPASATP